MAGAGTGINQYLHIYLLFVYILCSEEDATAQSPYHIQTNLQQSSFIPARNTWVWGTQILQDTNVLMVAWPPSELGRSVFSLRTIDCIKLSYFHNQFSEDLSGWFDPLRRPLKYLQTCFFHCTFSNSAKKVSHFMKTIKIAVHISEWKSLSWFIDPP